MRALILRRVYLIEAGASGPVLVGPLTLPDMIRLQGFLTRNGQPYSILDPETDPDAVQMIARLSPQQGDYPLVVCPDGTLLRNPTEAGACAVHRAARRDDRTAYLRRGDRRGGTGWPRHGGVCRLGGLSSAGRRKAMPSAARLGPAPGSRTISAFRPASPGQALTARAFVQAQKFGAQFVLPVTVSRLDCSGDGRPMTFGNDGRLARAGDGDRRRIGRRAIEACASQP